MLRCILRERLHPLSGALETAQAHANQHVPITELKPEFPAVVETDGNGGGAGLGAALHGSSPSESYIELERGLSTMKLPPKLLLELWPYACVDLGVLNIVAVVRVVADVVRLTRDSGHSCGQGDKRLQSAPIPHCDPGNDLLTQVNSACMQ